jgi:hypothetical protein
VSVGIQIAIAPRNRVQFMVEDSRISHHEMVMARDFVFAR